MWKNNIWLYVTLRWKHLHYIKSPYVCPCTSCPWSWGDKDLVPASNPRIALINHHNGELVQALHDPQPFFNFVRTIDTQSWHQEPQHGRCPGCWVTVSPAMLQDCLIRRGLGMSEISSSELLGSKFITTASFYLHRWSAFSKNHLWFSMVSYQLYYSTNLYDDGDTVAANCST